MHIVNYYELLGLEINATTEDIKKAYERKMVRTKNENMSESLKTAYYTLSDEKRRNKYDRSIGIHKYKKVGVAKKSAKGMSRLVLTILDALMTFYWCLLIAIIGCSLAYIYYKEKNITFTILRAYFEKYDLEAYILGLFALVDLVSHYYIRRMNRYLKHMDWEIKE